MASFSPAPPRRVSRMSSVGSPPPGPSAPKRNRGGRGQSRFSTPIQQGPLASVPDDESVLSGSGMDVDEAPEFERGLKAETLFSKSKEMTVTFYAQLPVEVRQALRNADFFREAYTGDVDPETGFAVVASTETCFVWKYSQALTGTPTCYVFRCPRETQPPPMTTTFHALVPYGPLREPGLIVCSRIGQIRFWDSIGMGLAGGDNFSSSELPLQPDEFVTTLTRADPQIYIASTSTGRLFRLLVTSSGGRYHLSTHPFSRPSSSLSLSRFIWGSQEMQAEPGNVNGVAVGPVGADGVGREVWALVDTRLQMWHMSLEGWEQLRFDEEVGDLTREAIREHSANAPKNDMELDLELLDLKMESSNDLIILISFAGQEDENAMDGFSLPRRIYAVVRVRHVAGTLDIRAIQAVPYQSTSSSGAPMHPRLQIVARRKLIAIQFGDTVTLCALENEYMDRLELKSATDRTLGVGIVEGEGELLILTAATMMHTYVDVDEVAQWNPETGRANLIKSTMTKAILYGAYPENPLHFSFPPEIDEEALMTGAEQLSEAILESDTEVVRAQHDLHAQMTTRKERLSFLIKFINDNSALTKMSQRSRQQLATDAEKLYAAHQLWLRHSENLQQGRNPRVLQEAIYHYMHAIGEGHHEDPVRAFLRLRVGDIGGLFRHVLNIVRTALSQMDQPDEAAIPQANQIILTILQSAQNYRRYNLGVYGVTLPLIKPWTSLPGIIDVVTELFNVTTQLAEAPSGDPETAQRSVLPRSQLPELAACLFESIQERLDWLSSPIAAEEAGVERERSELDDVFRQLRPEVLETLRRNDFAPEAFKLAEDYHDFRSLAALCHKGKVYPPHENPNAARIERYMSKFKEAFTNELYQWYIEHGELRTMFAQDHGEYLDVFLREHPHTGISWIHDIGRGRFGPASEALRSEADHATELVSKHLMLSIGKLSYLAQLQEGNMAIDESVLDSFHDGLDFVSVHDSLIEDLKAALATVRTRQSLEMQVETIAKAKARNLTDRKALQNVFKHLVRQLLHGKALSTEDMADVLSLKDNDHSVDDFTTALQLLAHSDNMPAVRRLNAFRALWRRIYIHDEWSSIRQTAGVSDADLNARLRATALYAALQTTTRTGHARMPEGYRLSPSQALDVASEQDVALRWPGMSPDEVTSVVRDYQRDSQLLEDLELEGMYESIAQLVCADEGIRTP